MAAAPASVEGAVSGGGGGLLEGFKIKFDSKFGSVLSDMKKFNDQWDKLNKAVKPAADLWNKAQGAFNKVLGIFKGLIAPLAIAGGLFAAFLLTGEAGRAVFGIFGNIIGAFADILTASLMPAITPIIKALVAALPTWQKIFGSDEWRNAMTRLGEALGRLVTAGMDVFLIVIKQIVEVMPMFIDFFDQMVLLLASALTYLKEHPEFLKAIAAGITIIVGAIIDLGAAGVIAIFTGLALAIGAVGSGIKFIVDHWDDIKNFFGTLERAVPVLASLADSMDRITKGVGILAGAGAAAGGLFGAVGNFFGGIGKAVGIPGFQSGGVVPYTGLAVVHAGETIIPSGGGGGGGGGNITVQVMGPIYGTDQRSAEELAKRVSEILRREWLGNLNTVR